MKRPREVSTHTNNIEQSQAVEGGSSSALIGRGIIIFKRFLSYEVQADILKDILNLSNGFYRCNNEM